MKKILSYFYSQIAIYFYFTAKPHFINPLNKLRITNEKNAERALRSNTELWKIIQYMLQKSSSTGCEYSDLFELYKSICHGNYKFILELGSGISTAVVAYAIKNKNYYTKKPVFVSMEENIIYYHQIKNIFPSQLAPYVSLNLSNRIEKLYNGYLGCQYGEIPDYPYELIFIDGPTERSSPGSPKCFNADIVNIANKAKNYIKAILDQRIWTYWILKKILPNAKIKYYPIKKISVLEIPKYELE